MVGHRPPVHASPRPPGRVGAGAGQSGSSRETIPASRPKTGRRPAPPGTHFYTRRRRTAGTRASAPCATAESDTGDHPPGSGHSSNTGIRRSPHLVPLAVHPRRRAGGQRAGPAAPGHHQPPGPQRRPHPDPVRDGCPGSPTSTATPASPCRPSVTWPPSTGSTVTSPGGTRTKGWAAPWPARCRAGRSSPSTLLLALHQGVLLLQLASRSSPGGRPTSWSGAWAWAGPSPRPPGWPSGCAGPSPGWPTPPSGRWPCSPSASSGWSGPSRRPGEHRRGGWRLLAVALALSILAGFPETSFIDGLFVAWWAVLRLAGPGRAGVAAGGGPAGRRGRGRGWRWPPRCIVAFADYLPYAYVGAHTGGFADTSLPTAPASPSWSSPTRSGPSSGSSRRPAAPTPSPCGAASAASCPSPSSPPGWSDWSVARQRPLRIGLGAWIAGLPAPHLRVPARGPSHGRRSPASASPPSTATPTPLGAGRRGPGRPGPGRHRPPADPPPGAGGRRRRSTGALAAWAAVTAWPLLTHAVGPRDRPEHRHLYPVGEPGRAPGSSPSALLAVGRTRSPVERSADRTG